MGKTYLLKFDGISKKKLFVQEIFAGHQLKLLRFFFSDYRLEKHLEIRKICKFEKSK